MSINAFVEVATSVTNISCITQVTLKPVNYWSFVIMFIRRDYRNQIFATLTHFALRMVSWWRPAFNAKIRLFMFQEIIFLLPKNYWCISTLILLFGTVCVYRFLLLLFCLDYLSSTFIKRLLMESTPFLFFAMSLIEIISGTISGQFAVRESFTARNHFCGPAHLQPTNEQKHGERPS